MIESNPAFLHLTTTDRGGAGMAAVRIHRALANSGFHSHMVVGDGIGGDGITVCGGPAASLPRIASKALFRSITWPRYYFRNQRYGLPSIAKTVESVAAQIQLKPDAIVAHALTDLISFASVKRLARRFDARVLWSLMDMASFTGGCHYAWGCEGYTTGCGDCPALRFGSGPKDWSAKTLNEKRSALAQMRTTVVAASTWLADQARASALFCDTPIEIVPLSVSPETFAPRDSVAVRSELGLDASRPVVFFGARDHGDARKGMSILEEALKKLASLRGPGLLPTLLVAGNGAPFEALAGEGYVVRQLGMLPPEGLAQAYAAADLYVSPSVEDSGPMMINEAVMSGTPVIAFDVGVAIDLIEPGATGVIASRRNADALAAAMTHVLDWSADKKKHATMRAREIGLSRCSPTAQAKALARLALSDERQERPA
ncbi:glycosyltransferase [Erythrobacter sp. HI0063]|jgi:glycosyltransferase involved in cell wall biosynthesis|uniref:glycosyltransferase n=1 Tax=Erythrobacter sp. HI0063 TaxID=1822240 RepID=UPI0018D4C11C|nr:glycosyltransferase [Erythrobacter sp. HI0063]